MPIFSKQNFTYLSTKTIDKVGGFFYIKHKQFNQKR